MKLVLILAVIFLPALAVVLMSNQKNKRGCGRGCATCPNRYICHPEEKGEDVESAQKDG